MALLLFAHRTESGVCVCVCVCVSVPDTDRYFKAVYFTGKTSVLWNYFFIFSKILYIEKCLK